MGITDYLMIQYQTVTTFTKCLYAKQCWTIIADEEHFKSLNLDSGHYFCYDIGLQHRSDPLSIFAFHSQKSLK